MGGTQLIRVDVRIIAATNRNLEAAVKEGRFREDLFYRINVVPIVLPPLRGRKEDVPALAQFFMQRFSDEAKKKPSRRFLKRPWKHSWVMTGRETCVSWQTSLKGPSFSANLQPSKSKICLRNRRPRGRS